ncbi:MAG: lysophospholipid acyltransferase family protein [Deltaproteobacteria bacterium]|nr:lysophospholipid acyltransferase family protein [Deltaproteobacteria bacterium]
MARPVAKSDRLSRLGRRLLPVAGSVLVRLWGWSCFRIAVLNDEDERLRAAAGQGCVYVTWHQRLFNIYFLHHRRPITIMISRSRDGDLAARVAELLGFGTVRGSSSRGGPAAMLELIEEMKKKPGTCAGMLGDGPRGPARKLKMGTIRIAQATGVPIVPVAYGAKRRKLFSSWDRFLLPLPFSPLVAAFGEPVLVPENAPAEELEVYRKRVEESLNRLVSLCDGYFAR